jgi:hypothetical protein
VLQKKKVGGGRRLGDVAQALHVCAALHSQSPEFKPWVLSKKEKERKKRNILHVFEKQGYLL